MPTKGSTGVPFIRAGVGGLPLHRDLSSDNSSYRMVDPGFDNMDESLKKEQVKLAEIVNDVIERTINKKKYLPEGWPKRNKSFIKYIREKKSLMDRVVMEVRVDMSREEPFFVDDRNKVHVFFKSSEFDKFLIVVQDLVNLLNEKT